MSDAVQLELLFDPSPAPAQAPAAATAESRENAPQERSDVLTPPRANGSAGASLSVDSGRIPSRCPVVGTPVCYYADCHHFQHGGCGHPEATAKPKRRRRAPRR